jgi:UDP-2,3-diacylglucosamine pyrophosphatase LpxH
MGVHYTPLYRILLRENNFATLSLALGEDACISPEVLNVNKPNNMSKAMREVYIISDLHLGGIDDFRMMRNPKKLAEFIDFLSSKTETPKELVIAGDFVDFLAEKTENSVAPWQALIRQSLAAVNALNRIAHSNDFRCVFSALKNFIKIHKSLTILLGNHDIELSYPAVRKELEKILGVKEGHGFRFIYDGEAYIIGNAIIEHGNRYDRWNQVAYDELRQLRTLQSRRQDSNKNIFNPPAGSRLVAEVMNPLKERYSFIDLLKPENEAVLPILLSLLTKRDSFTKIAEIIKTLAPAINQGVDKNSIPSSLTYASASNDVTKETSIQSQLEKINQWDKKKAEGFLYSLNDEKKQPTSYLTNASASVGFTSLISLAIEKKDKKAEVLKHALEALRHDNTFNTSYEPKDSEYLKASRSLVNNNFKYVIFGHTHHAKKIEFNEEDGGDSGVYFNTGTWADLMKVPKDIWAENQAESNEKLNEFLINIKENNIEQYRKFLPTCVVLFIDEDEKQEEFVSKAELRKLNEKNDISQYIINPEEID